MAKSKIATKKNRVIENGSLIKKGGLGSKHKGSHKGYKQPVKKVSK